MASLRRHEREARGPRMRCSQCDHGAQNTVSSQFLPFSIRINPASKCSQIS